MNFHRALGCSGSSTAQANTRGASHRTTYEVVCHSPSDSCLLRPANRAPSVGPAAPSSQATERSSALSVGIRLMSETNSHTRTGDARILLRTSTVGLSA